MKSIKAAAKRTLPKGARRWLRHQAGTLSLSPTVAWIHFGRLRRLTPVSQFAGFDRGQPVDRYYIEAFLARYASDIRGRVLEIGDDTYTRQFGGQQVVQSDVLSPSPGNPSTTIIADLTSAEVIPSETFDCVVLTQTLQVIYDMPAALRTVHRILKPGGVVLATFSGISRISRYDMDRWGEFWRVTTLSARRLFEERFPPTGVEVDYYGNVVSAVAFLHGLAAHELRQEELDHHDPDYEVVITVRATRPAREPNGYAQEHTTLPASPSTMTI
ncbi:MAG: methyltransferase domain-containing protein [Chloroflexi bacterium]|nr:methyltransferase domain-containing protein [Chloroflexota bacterium]